MGQGAIGDRLRERIRKERDTRGWSRAIVRGELHRRGVEIHISTIAKIEDGDRAVRVDELSALADLFGMSTDALIGRRSGSDLVWAVSKLASNAQRMASEVSALGTRLGDELEDVRTYADARSGGDIQAAANTALVALERARGALTHLAGQFPLGGIGTRS